MTISLASRNTAFAGYLNLQPATQNYLLLSHQPCYFVPIFLATPSHISFPIPILFSFSDIIIYEYYSSISTVSITALSLFLLLPLLFSSFTTEEEVQLFNHNVRPAFFPFAICRVVLLLDENELEMMYKLRNIYNSYYDSLILFFRVRVRVKKEHFLSCFILRNCTTSDDDGYLLLKKLYCSKLLALFSLTLPVWLASRNISPCSTTTAPFLLGCLVWFGAAATSNSNNKHTILHIKHIRLLTVRTSSIPFHLCVCVYSICVCFSFCVSASLSSSFRSIPSLTPTAAT